MSAPSLLASAGLWWSARAPREQRLLTVATALILAATVYALAVAPALRVMRTHADTQTRLQNEWQTMVQLQAQAKALQAQPRQNAAAARAALQSAAQSLGAQADVSFGPEGARLVLRNVDGQTLARWLATARTQVGSVPVQANINRSGAVWSGTVLMTLPAP
jgi:general secretion pathway protein M